MASATVIEGLAGPPGHRGHRARARHGGQDGGRRLRPGGQDRGDRALDEGQAGGTAAARYLAAGQRAARAARRSPPPPACSPSSSRGWPGRSPAVKAATVAAGTEQVTLEPAGREDGPVGRAPSNAAQKNRELAILLPGGATYDRRERARHRRHPVIRAAWAAEACAVSAAAGRNAGSARAASGVFRLMWRRHARDGPRGELTTLPDHPTVPINRKEDKTLNLNLKVKPDGHRVAVPQLRC